MSDTLPRIQTFQAIKSQMRRYLKKFSQNGEKMSQNGENLHKAIYASFHKTKLFSPTQGHFKCHVELPKNLVICFKETLASLSLDTTKTPDSCLLLLNFKQ